jgi:peptidyl-prolyl cis-trans isomerase D
MNFFRRFAGPVVALFTITFLAWMVFELSGITGSAGFSRPTAVGEVNGRSLDSRQFELMVQQATQQAQQQSPGQVLGADAYSQIRDRVWGEWVDQAILESEYERRGLTVSEEELADAIRTTPLPEFAQEEAFQTDGRFDFAKYQAWLASPGAAQVIPALEARYRTEMLRSKLLRVVTADAFISDAELWLRYRDDHETVTIDLAAILPQNAVPDSAVTITDAEVQAYYDAHRDQYSRPETAHLSYVMIPRAIEAADTAAALERARAIRAELVGGANFEDVARRESDDAVSGSRGGSLGTWARGDMVPQFDSVAARAPIGRLTEPFLSPFGYHLLEVSRRAGDSITARHILVKIDLAGERRDRIDARADSLERLAADRVDPAALDTAARILGLRVFRAVPVQRNTQVVAGRAVIPNVSTWTFQRAIPGAIGTIEEGEEGLYLFRIDSLVPEGVAPLEVVRNHVERQVRDQKKWELARRIGEQLQKRLDEGATLDMATRALDLPHQVVGPFTRTNPVIPIPTLVGTAFSLQPGQRSKVIDTEEGLYLVESVARVPADSAKFATEREQLQSDAIRFARQTRVRLYLEALRAEAKIVDRRLELQRANEAALAALDSVP